MSQQVVDKLDQILKKLEEIERKLPIIYSWPTPQCPTPNVPLAPYVGPYVSRAHTAHTINPHDPRNWCYN